jgi:DNA-binding IclR family transcriptional regulator
MNWLSSKEAITGGMSLSVARALSILQILSPQRPEVGITELSRELKLSKSIVHRLVRTLEHFDLLERNPESRRYRLSYDALRLGRLFLESRVPEREALPVMRELVAATGHSSHLAMLRGDRMVIVASVESPGPIKFTVSVGDYRLGHTSAMGKAGLTTLADEEVDAILERHGMEPRTPFSITDPAVLKAQIQEARRLGYTTNWEEHHIGVGSVAAPVRCPYLGQVLAISIGFPTQAVDRAEIPQLGEVLRKAADALSYRLYGEARSDRDHSATAAPMAAREEAGG